MSVILRSLVRDPLITRPLTRAFRRRLDDDWWLDEWRPKKIRRFAPEYESPLVVMDDMSRQMAAAMNRMQEFAEDLNSLDELVNRYENGKRKLSPSKKRNESIVKRTESGGLQLALDVGDFKPEDLKIKLVDDNLVVEALSEHSGENSYQRNQFKRWFKLPDDCKLDEIRSKLTNDNKLIIDLPSRKPIEQKSSRSIPIEMEKSSKSKEAIDQQQQSLQDKKTSEANKEN